MAQAVSDAALARDIADEAGRLLLALRANPCAALGERGDAEANALILRRLRAARPDDFILSEESHDDRARCAARRVWIVDPLDGTREYADGRDDWAVHVGLAIDGLPVAGAVALPALAELYDSATVRPPPATQRDPRIVVSRTRAPAEATALSAALGGTLVPMGSAGAKAMAIVRGDADIYFHAGGQHEWDNCAPVAVALAAGLHASRADGTPLTYNCVETFVPDLLICGSEWAGPCLSPLTRGS
ncbi:MAG: 3'(2'),5'-bisphosphate nucleotidase CysQ [Pseudomonadota bacterium]